MLAYFTWLSMNVLSYNIAFKIQTNMGRNKQIISIVKLLLLMSLFSCTRESLNNNGTTPSNTGVDYGFTIIYDGYTYKIKGNTLKDNGFSGPIINKCIATKAKFIELSITDVTSHNFISGKPMKCDMNVVDNFVKGINMLTLNLSFVSFYKNQNACPGCNGGGDNRLPFNIIDLGTPSTGTLGTPNYVFGKTINGKFSGTVYTVPAGSNNATVPHSLSIEFICVRQY
jgi:hypothetical protein